MPGIFRAIRYHLAKRRYNRESVTHPDQVCEHCGGEATRLIVIQFPHKQMYVCRDRKTCEATKAYEKSF
jgi:hypothetical protein